MQHDMSKAWRVKEEKSDREKERSRRENMTDTQVKRKRKQESVVLSK